MARIVDARGLSCPQPVLETLTEMKKGQSEDIVVLVDTDTSKENVCRAADGQGWHVKSIDAEGEAYKITLEKG
jgi:tRNA 2-thiouridine synthesizing protein A